MDIEPLLIKVFAASSAIPPAKAEHEGPSDIWEDDECVMTGLF